MRRGGGLVLSSFVDPHDSDASAVGGPRPKSARPTRYLQSSTVNNLHKYLFTSRRCSLMFPRSSRMANLQITEVENWARRKSRKVRGEHENFSSFIVLGTAM